MTTTTTTDTPESVAAFVEAAEIARLKAEVESRKDNARMWEDGCAAALRGKDDWRARATQAEAALAASEERERGLREASDLAAAVADRPTGWHWSIVQQADDRFLASLAQPGAGWSACGLASDPGTAMREALAHPRLAWDALSTGATTSSEGGAS